MKQKFSVTVADIHMNILCDETQEAMDAAVSALDGQVRGIITAAGGGCTKTEAVLLAALDAFTKCDHLTARVAELENYVSKTDPMGDTYEATLLRGENETLRAQLQVSRGEYDALLQDNATLFQLNAKLMRQNSEANSRADRMHNQVLSILTEVRELRERLAAMCVETHTPVESYTAYEPEPQVEITPQEQRVTQKYEQLDIDDILNTAPAGSGTPHTQNPLLDATEDAPAPENLTDLIDFDGAEG